MMFRGLGVPPERFAEPLRGSARARHPSHGKTCNRMIELLDTLPDINVQPAEYKRLLGYPRERVLSGRARELAEMARAWYAANGRPWVYARQADGISYDNGSILIDGVAFNSTTRSGSNDVSGMMEFLFTNDALVGNNLPSGETAETTTDKSWDTTAQVGGPFIKDKLWYFVSAQYLSDDTQQGGTPRTERDPRLFAKLTWQASPKDKVEGFLEWDRYDITGRGGDAFTPLEATVTETAPEYVWNFAWTRTVSPDTVFDVRLTGYWGYYYLDPQNGYDVAGHYDFLTGLYSVNSYYYFKADRTRNQLVSSITHHASDFIKGDHDFKFGMEIERSAVRNRTGKDSVRSAIDRLVGTPPAAAPAAKTDEN